METMETSYFGIQMPVEMKRAIKQLAKVNHRSMSGQVLAMLDAQLKLSRTEEDNIEWTGGN